MKIMERIVSEIARGKDTEYTAFRKKRDAADARLGFPPVRTYGSMCGAEKTNVLALEREWESLAAMEATYEAASADEEWKALGSEWSSFGVSQRHELWSVGLV